MSRINVTASLTDALWLFVRAQATTVGDVLLLWLYRGWLGSVQWTRAAAVSRTACLCEIDCSCNSHRSVSDLRSSCGKGIKQRRTLGDDRSLLLVVTAGAARSTALAVRTKAADINRTAQSEFSSRSFVFQNCGNGNLNRQRDCSVVVSSVVAICSNWSYRFCYLGWLLLNGADINRKRPL